MSILDGAPEQALKDFGSDFKDGALLVPGEETDDGQGGFTTGEPVRHGCKVLVTRYKDFRRPIGVPASDRRILILSASLPAGVYPDKGHKVEAPDPSQGLTLRTFDVIEKGGDAAGALYELQGR